MVRRQSHVAREREYSHSIQQAFSLPQENGVACPLTCNHLTGDPACE